MDPGYERFENFPLPAAPLALMKLEIRHRKTRHQSVCAVSNRSDCAQRHV